MPGQPNKESLHTPRLEKLGRYYLVALCGIAISIILSQLLIQKSIKDQENDAEIINLAGRQRMLSQRISKSVLLIQNTEGLKQRQKWAEELRQSLREWQVAHHDLTKGNPHKKTDRPASRRLKELYAQITPSHRAIMENAQSLLNILEKDILVQSESMANHIQHIIEYEPEFLSGMDTIVQQHEEEAKAKVVNLRNIELLLLFFALGIIGLEIRFIFLPSIKNIRKTFHKLTESESRTKDMLREISSLYDSLELAYQDLLDVEIEVEDFSLLAKSDPWGNLVFLSDKFTQTMEYETATPVHFFDWLASQGYNQKDLNQIQRLLIKGSSWTGEIRTTNEFGDFIWWKISLIPILSTDGEPEEIKILGIDVTEKKEAESKSREINKERIEKKVKEQRYRSVLILEGQEEERKRISRDLHDGIGQWLTAMKYNLEGVNRVQTAHEKEKLKVSKNLLSRVIKEIRRISFNLAPSTLSDYGIVSVLSRFSKEMTKVSDIEVAFENRTGFISRLEGNVENNVYRIAQEAVNNAIKYSQAKIIKIILTHGAYHLNLEIKDDGQGFDLDKLEKTNHFSTSGHGIFNIKERASLINAFCEVNSQIGKGTSIRISIPLE
ncbi:MAG: type IV pili methyl-accepting chemotaxis transducer N-terminal domain-containing protein [Cyclobacteriaceae bacterium]